MIITRFVGGPLAGIEGIQATEVTLAAHSGSREIGRYLRGPDDDGVAVYRWVPAPEEAQDDLPDPA
ncbi:hypothetical protein [Streptomyces sp. NPDC057939]|uniref:hypothetical protein n=1 Tax=Streptomyces sp. NPDC057939 TaxID=3346284 RepID=UPI0036EE343B